MIALQLLRMLGDLSLYYAFAAFFLRLTGSADLLPGLLLPALCYALSAALQGHRALRLAALLPQLLLFFLPGLTPAERLAALPPVLYVLWLGARGDYSLGRYRQLDSFLLFCRVYPCFFLLLCLLGGYSALCAASLPPALCFCCCSVLLLRVLRHEPSLACRPTTLLSNALPLLLLLALVWLLQSLALLQALAALLSALYQGLLAPLLLLALYAVAFVLMHTLYPLLQLLTSLGGSGESSSALELAAEGLSEGIMQESGGGSELLRTALGALGLLLLLLAAFALLLLLFRRLAGERLPQGGGRGATAQLRSALDFKGENGSSLPLRGPGDPVRQVRRQYRRYLQLCEALGYVPAFDATTQDILDNSRLLLPDPAAAEELRALYLAARYGGRATRADARRAAALLRQLHRASRP